MNILLQSKASEWVGCVAVDKSGDWVVCGGSMGPTFFHLSSPSTATKTAMMDLPAGTVTQAAIFVDDRVSGKFYPVHCLLHDSDCITASPEFLISLKE